jgi:hypothetical protein
MRRPQYDDCCGVDGAVLVDYELQGHHALNIRLRQDQRVRERCVLRRSDRLIDLACKERRRSPRTGPNRVGAATRRPGLECRHRQISRSATQDREEETRRRSVQDPTDRRSPVHDLPNARDNRRTSQIRASAQRSQSRHRSPSGSTIVSQPTSEWLTAAARATNRLPSIFGSLTRAAVAKAKEGRTMSKSSHRVGAKALLPGQRRRPEPARLPAVR